MLPIYQTKLSKSDSKTSYATLYKEWYRPMTKLFVKSPHGSTPYREQPRSTRNVVAASALSIKADKSRPNQFRSRSPSLSRPRHAEIGKVHGIEIHRGRGLELQKLRFTSYYAFDFHLVLLVYIKKWKHKPLCKLPSYSSFLPAPKLLRQQPWSAPSK